MSQAKRWMEDNETKRDAAVSIALEAGVLTQCEFHEIIFEGNGILDIESAYRLGNSQFSSGGNASNIFSSRREMTDFIKDVVHDHPAEECPICEKIRGRDQLNSFLRF